MVNTRPLWATILAVAFLGESITVQGMLGIFCVVSGLGLVAFSGGGDVSGWNNRDLLFPLGAALTFASGNVARRYLFTNTGATPLDTVALNELPRSVGLLSFILYSQRGQLRSFFRIPRQAYAYFVGCGIFSALVLFGLFVALERAR